MAFHEEWREGPKNSNISSIKQVWLIKGWLTGNGVFRVRALESINPVVRACHRLCTFNLLHLLSWDILLGHFVQDMNITKGKFNRQVFEFCYILHYHKALICFGKTLKFFDLKNLISIYTMNS